MEKNTAYRFAAGVALVAALILVWVNLAVGLIGTPDDLANLMYVGVFVVCIVGAIVARFRPDPHDRADGARRAVDVPTTFHGEMTA